MPAVRHPLRVHLDVGDPVDVEVHATPTATVGDLADEMARTLGLTVGGHTVVARWPIDRTAEPPPRSAPLSTHGPPAGATVLLVRSVQPAGSGGRPAVPAPARLVDPSGSSQPLRYGDQVVGDLVVSVDTSVRIRSTGAAAARIDGSPLLGDLRLHDGALVSVGDCRWTLRIDGPLRPRTPGGWSRPHRGRRRVTLPHDPRPVELPAPPPPMRLPALPVLTALVPLLMGVALWVATRSLLSMGFMLFTVVFVVASGLEARRAARVDERAALAAHHDDLADAVQRLDELAADQHRANAALGSTVTELRELTADLDRRTGDRVWHRSAVLGDPATVTLGTAQVPRRDPVVVPTQGRRTLRLELRALAEEHATVADSVVVDLRDGPLVVEAIDDDQGRDVVRSVVCQLAAAFSPDQLVVELVVPAGRRDCWRALWWLPHVRTTSPPVGRAVPLRMQVVDATDAPEGGDLQCLIAPPPSADDPTGTVLTVWLTGPQGPHPAPAAPQGAVLRIEGRVGSLRQFGPEPRTVEAVELDPMGHDDAEPCCRRLAQLHPAPMLGAAGAAGPVEQDPPSQVPLTEVLADADLLGSPHLVCRRWERGASRTAAPHLATPVGLDPHGARVDLDLASDGPHLLIAGTTGSGKSELLRTFLVSAALHHSPERVQFLLVDYKGGAAFGPLSALPHTVGTITDLSGALAPRALSSLRAELRAREAAAAARGADRWNGPALLVVIDELATLVADQPEFVDGLVDLAQRGRSLGMHLVLATQRPAGVVTDAIRANVTMRIALRTTDEQDSRDVVDLPDAAHLPRQVPGRAVIRVGPGQAVRVQTAHGAARLAPTPPVRIEALGSGASISTALGEQDSTTTAAGPTPLELAVRTARAAADLTGWTGGDRPWIDPLPDQVDLDQVDLDRVEREGCGSRDGAGGLVIGLVDRPDLRRHDPLVLDLARDGNALVVGASGTGRTTTLATIAAAAARQRGRTWQLAVVSAAPERSGTTAIRTWPSVVDVIDVADAERVLRLLRLVAARLDREVPVDPAAERTVVVVDGIAAFEERYDRLNRGEAIELLTRIARDGRSVGVHVVVTAQRRGEVPVGLLGLLGARLVLRCGSSEEASLWGLSDEAADPDLPPGRCRVGSHWAQVAVAAPDGRPRSLVTESPAAVPRLATCVHADELDPGDPDLWSVPLGLDGDSVRPIHWELGRAPLVVAGTPRSGVTSALRLLAHSLQGASWAPSGDADEVMRWAAEVTDAAASGAPRLVLVDDLAELLEGPDGDVWSTVLVELVRAARDRPLRLVVGAEIDSLTRCYGEAVSALRRGRTGILLGPGAEDHAQWWHTSVPARSDLPSAPGRGWLLAPGTVRPIQLALAR